MNKILITGGNGNIAKIIKNKLSSSYYIVSPTKSELNVLNINEIHNYLLVYKDFILILFNLTLTKFNLIYYMINFI